MGSCSTMPYAMESTHLEQPSIFLGPRVLRPWVRATARLIDILLAGLLLGWIGMVVHPLWVHGRGTALILFLGLILWIPFEAFLLSRWGTTFGKAILNMQVCDQHGKKLTYSRAVFRAMWVWAAGLVVGIPLIAPDTEGKIVLALIFAAPALLYIYWRLYRKAATSWDDKLARHSCSLRKAWTDEAHRRCHINSLWCHHA
jgi:uncharacterized RDD family membrane protein YckC